MIAASDRASNEHLGARIHLIAKRVERSVLRRRLSDTRSEDRFRGLYLSDSFVDDLLTKDRVTFHDEELDEELREIERRADEAAMDGEALRLRSVQANFGLSTFEVDALLLALAPDLDARFQWLFGYLNDDVTLRRATVGLALELLSANPLSPMARAVFKTTSPLVAGGLVDVLDIDRPFPSRSLRVPDRVASYLLGDSELDASVAGVVVDEPLSMNATWPELSRAIDLRLTPVFLQELTPGASLSRVASLLNRTKRKALWIDLAGIATSSDPLHIVGAVVREARLLGAVVIAASADGTVDKLLPVLARLTSAPVPVVMTGIRTWDPSWTNDVPVVIQTPPMSADDRTDHWLTALNSTEISSSLAGAGAAFRLSPRQIQHAVRAANLRSAVLDRALTQSDIEAAARAQNAAGLERLSHRVDPRVSWDDLVLPPEQITELRELTKRARHRDQVIDVWGMGVRAFGGRGITALFAGDSGTGKTRAAEVVAHDLHLDLYAIDLSSVVDKYIGETEKNLDRIFDEAERVNGVLLFDEADAIFGKRSDVQDARDRYANIQVGYLLQRMERFDGIAILTTNLRANLDDAFTRRIDVIVDFPLPDVPARRHLWKMHLTPLATEDSGIDLDFMAARFQLSGGDIRNICVSAAYSAANSGQPVSMSSLAQATEREYRKLGRLTIEQEFGPYLSARNAVEEATTIQ